MSVMTAGARHPARLAGNGRLDKTATYAVRQYSVAVYSKAGRPFAGVAAVHEQRSPSAKMRVRRYALRELSRDAAGLRVEVFKSLGETPYYVTLPPRGLATCSCEGGKKFLCVHVETLQALIRDGVITGPLRPDHPPGRGKPA